MRMNLIRECLTLWAVTFAATALVLAGPVVPPQAKAPAAGSVIQSQETDTTGVVAELYECKRKEGVLTIKVRLRNTSNQKASYKLYSAREYDQYYVTAGGKKHFLLKDSEGTHLTVQAGGGGFSTLALKPGQTSLWWGKYPAPPADVKKINFTMPRVAPFDDIPISDQ